MNDKPVLLQVRNLRVQFDTRPALLTVLMTFDGRSRGMRSPGRLMIG